MTIPSFDTTDLDEICSVLASAVGGLTESEIGSILSQLGINDPEPSNTKRKRLFSALYSQQCDDRSGNRVVRFINQAMDLTHHACNKGQFDTRRKELNKVLVFRGYFVGEDGRLLYKEKARSLAIAERRASKLRTELRRRNAHPDVLVFCRADLVRSNCSLVLEGVVKSIAEKIRRMSGLSADGATLIDLAFGIDHDGLRLLSFNRSQSESQRGDQEGMVNILRGMLSMNVQSETDTPDNQVNMLDSEVLDLLTIASLLHHSLDSATRINQADSGV
jgi:uncharacterized protein (TIGR02391 family)